MTVVNLNKARKAKRREVATAQAAQNRISFGRTRAERQQQASELERQVRDVDAHKRDR